MPARLEVYPNAKGEWRWRQEGRRPSEAFPSRSGAFEDALVERSTEQIVLLRQDGTVHGELYHETRSGGPPQRVDLLAATERGQAVSIGGY